MRQCRLRKKNVYKVAWIPSRYATQGKCLKLLVDGEWEDGWVVESVGVYQKKVEERHGYLFGGVSR